MRELPTGDVSFFFSDIEGSTRLAQRLGSSFRSVIDEHNDIVRGVVASTGGSEVRTVGDSFFLAFADAPAAVTSAILIQQQLETHAWPEEASVRVRIGIHTGTGELGGDDYVGVDVHRAARIGDVGHGGQVLVSDSTSTLVDDGVFRFHDLGVHQLKDLERPERLLQVDVPGLPAAFPPLRTITTRTNNLPASATSLLGRDDELAAISDLLLSHRVVTLLGSGGIGKTRLAIAVGSQAVSQFSDGVVFVDLSAVRESALVPSAIANALEVEDASLEAAGAHLAEREMLMVLDNFEQVLPAASSVAEILRTAPRVKVLVTSQAPLGLNGEQRFPVLPLATGGELDSPGVRLFVARASEVDPAFSGDPALVSHIVAALDGNPLAIELAASRVHVVPLEEMSTRLRDPGFLATAATDTPERHSSLAGALAWSHDLLEAPEQAALRRLAVFSGGMTVSAAEAVIAGEPVLDPLESVTELIDRSLLSRRTDGSGRLMMLDGVRRFAGERLEASGEEQSAAGRHTAWIRTMAAEAERGLQADRGEWWRSRLDTELANLRIALERLLDAGNAGAGLTVLDNVWRFMQSSGRLSELDSWLARFFALPTADTAGAGRAKGLMARGALHYWRSEAAPAIADYTEAVEIGRGLGDEGLLANAVYGLGTSFIIGARDDEALVALDEAEQMYAAAGDELARSNVAAAKLFYRVRTEGIAGLGPAFTEVGRLQLEAGWVVGAVQATYALVGVALAEGRYQAARAEALSGLEMAEGLSDRFLLAWGLDWLALVEIELGRLQKAGLLIGAGELARADGGGWSAEVIGMDNATTRLRSLLGEADAAAVIAAGRNLSLAEGLVVARGQAPDGSLAPEGE